MFLKLSVENVRKKGLVHYHFQNLKKVALVGENGSGKSSVLEALVFTLTGRDSSGGLCPTHLITRGEERLKTDLETGNWTITRTLTQKKNSTLSIRFDQGPKINTNQTRLFEMLMGDAEFSELAYLSAVVPGFFMRQNPHKRFALLSSILPKIDRVKFVADYSGFSEELVGKMCGNFLRGIPSYQNFSSYRLSIQKNRSKLAGRIEEIERTMSEEVVAPEAPAEIDLLPVAQQYMEDIAVYTSAYQTYMRDKNQYDYTVLESQRREKQRADITRKIAELGSYTPVPIPLSDDGVIGELKQNLIDLPEKPAVMQLPSSDCCPSCGQVVGSSLREQVTAENESKIRSYNDRLREANHHNKIIHGKIESIETALREYKAECDEIRKNNSRIKDLNESLNLQLATLVPMAVTAEPIAPIKPDMPEILERYGIGPYKKDITRLQMIAQDYLQKLSVYEYCFDNKTKGSQHIREIDEEIRSLDAEILRYEKFEHALRILPQEEVRAQLGELSFKNHTMDFTDGFDIRHESGTPYECLSSGERISLDVALCVKFQEFMVRKPGWCFVDDADLLDRYGRIVFPEDMQVFLALVSNDENSCSVSLQPLQMESI